MPFDHAAVRTSLALVHAGETVRIERFAFATVRDICHDIGLEAGQVVKCRASSIAALVLKSPAGRTFIVDQDWARWIEVSAVSPDGSRN